MIIRFLPSWFHLYSFEEENYSDEGRELKSLIEFISPVKSIEQATYNHRHSVAVRVRVKSGDEGMTIVERLKGGDFHAKYLSVSCGMKENSVEKKKKKESKMKEEEEEEEEEE